VRQAQDFLWRSNKSLGKGVSPDLKAASHCVMSLGKLLKWLITLVREGTPLFLTRAGPPGCSGTHHVMPLLTGAVDPPGMWVFPGGLSAVVKSPPGFPSDKPNK